MRKIKKFKKCMPKVTSRYIVYDDTLHMAFRNISDLAELLNVSAESVRKAAKISGYCKGHHVRAVNYYVALDLRMPFYESANDLEHIWIVNEDEGERYYNLTEAAYYLGCERSTVYRALRDGKTCKGVKLRYDAVLKRV